MIEICAGCGLHLFRGVDGRCSTCGHPAPPPPKKKEKYDNPFGGTSAV